MDSCDLKARFLQTYTIELFPTCNMQSEVCVTYTEDKARKCMFLSCSILHLHHSSSCHLPITMVTSLRFTEDGQTMRINFAGQQLLRFDTVALIFSPHNL